MGFRVIMTDRHNWETDEIIKTYNAEQDSYSMTKKKDSEKQADSAR